MIQGYPHLWNPPDGVIGVEDPDAPGSGSDPNTAQTLDAQFTATFPS